ncbi:amidophosphoribosyltransferase [Fusobacterium necrophorum]|uniref:Amidophosphoribosyltransferase n=1 Tax=Fusobacterium necrophorum TaxID=859 RepID=A0A4Q2L057_9FUSO|nr:amidophosphoribosyltransferase [Fusobacterium necrophorum]RXZ69321.1 amidophosphoribosyltransferase [Fusobacterium necrophorum]
MGILAVHSKKLRNDLVGIGYYGMYALQHRGQEGAGYTICDTITENKVRQKTIKDVGLVSDVFLAEDFQKFTGNILIAHTRYGSASTGSSRNCQPIGGESSMGMISLVHNGDLANKEDLKQELIENGMLFHTAIDTEIILKYLSIYGKYGYREAVLKTVERLKGCFALAMIINDKLIGVRDPEGLRPLCLGKIQEDMYVLASESCALDAIGAEFVRDIKAGEMVIIDNQGVESIQYQESHKKASSFEYIYFARPDSVIDGMSVYEFRHTTGRYLYQQHPVEADIVIGVPDSGVPAAIGYAEASGIPYSAGLLKNKYVGRTFIAPVQELRERAVKVKLNPIRRLIEGKRIVVVDDSIVRGTTSKKLIDILYEAGAKEVHFRSASPVVIEESYFGVNIDPDNILMGSHMTVEEIREKIGATTLEYLSLENLKKSLGNGEDFYIGCFKEDEKR